MAKVRITSILTILVAVLAAATQAITGLNHESDEA